MKGLWELEGTSDIVLEAGAVFFFSFLAPFGAAAAEANQLL